MRGAGLGAATISSTVPWQCWGAAGFQGCHKQSFAAAMKTCSPGSRELAQFEGNVDNCIITYADMNDAYNCEPKFCPEAMPKSTVANKGKTLDAATVKKIQNLLNAQLAANGLKTIGVDGKLGPGTCGAADYLGRMLNASGQPVSTVVRDYELNQGYCTAYTNPTLVGKATPIQTLVTRETTVLPNQEAITAPAPAWGVADPAVAALQQRLNQALDANGYLSIPLTGALDSATCGAMRWIKQNTGMDLLTESGANCKSYTDPVKKPASLDPSNAPKGSAPPAIAPAPPKPGGVSQASLMTGGILLALAGGAYYYAKKKGMV